jgi:hypothetical protein
LHNHDRVVISNTIWKFDEENIKKWQSYSQSQVFVSKSKYNKQKNFIKCDLDLNNLVSSRLCCHKQYNLNKKRKNSIKCDIELQKTWHHHDRAVISNIIWKYDEEILWNGKVKANVKFSCQNPSTKRGITIQMWPWPKEFGIIMICCHKQYILKVWRRNIYKWPNYSQR